MTIFAEKALYGVSVPLVGTYANTMLKLDVVKHAEFPLGAKIIAANHPSTTDPFFVAAMLHQQSFIMINNVLFQVPILGRYLRRSGHIPVIPGRGQEAIDAAIAHLKAGHTVMIFPEGEISPFDGGFNPARTGIARLALATGAPIIPVGIGLLRERIKHVKSTVSGVEEIGHWYMSGPYAMTVGHPITFVGDPDDRELTRQVADRAMRRIIEMATESELRINRNMGMSKGLFELI
jgi:1-acyl-sn-glycerol-3-phosphate acyltransferase